MNILVITVYSGNRMIIKTCIVVTRKVALWVNSLSFLLPLRFNWVSPKMKCLSTLLLPEEKFNISVLFADTFARVLLPEKHSSSLNNSLLTQDEQCKIVCAM